ncbi:MAG TPA: mechanosensitive ion channel family protein, partial [Anaerolineales bacterium]|nr:mechanosensitive ion channel family protein [Anaerolineales bacterium]
DLQAWLSVNGPPFLLYIALPFALAYVISLLSGWLARRTSRLSGLTRRNGKTSFERRQTVEALGSSAISLLAFVLATVFVVSRYVAPDTLLWVVGLFSAAFGFAARPVVSDWMAGLSFIFRDTFDVGDKVEFMILGASVPIEGVIERINVSDCVLRAPTGEQFTVPNGEIRVVRNFTRGAFSGVRLKLIYPAADLPRILPALEAAAAEAPTLLPDLLEPWRLIATDAPVSDQVEILLIARSRHGEGAQLKLDILKLLQERLSDLHASSPH